jgi:hypothetical protein
VAEEPEGYYTGKGRSKDFLEASSVISVSLLQLTRPDSLAERVGFELIGGDFVADQ